MKKVTITNATVIPQFKKQQTDPDLILKVFSVKNNKNIVQFTVSTPQKDGAVKSGRLYERCAIMVTDGKELTMVKSTLKNNAIINITGHEESFRTDAGHYLRTVKVTEIKLISEGFDEIEDIPMIGEDE